MKTLILSLLLFFSFGVQNAIAKEQKIIQYILLYKCSGFKPSPSVELMDKVNEYIKNGFVPFGGIAINNNGCASQAMVKYEK